MSIEQLPTFEQPTAAQEQIDRIHDEIRQFLERMSSGDDDSCTPALDHQDWVLTADTDPSYEQLAGWQLNPFTSLGYIGRFAIGQDGSLYGAYWTEKHLFYNIDELLSDYSLEQLAWIADIIHAHNSPNEMESLYALIQKLAD